ncbi:MAG: NAD(P)-dependent glycerol-3-phosphate dehydrogenase [Planctomycetes bacterium]|nr:NAD(P)-dependent glycerol-3-phosphate dehydrogenase [Planctomycetota bacterium]
MTRVAVIGNGGFGTAMALLLLENQFEVTIWGHDEDTIDRVREERVNRRYLPGVLLPPGLKFTHHQGEAVEDAALVVIAVPTAWLRETLENFRGMLPRRAALVSLVKGIEPKTLLRPSQVIREIFPRRSVAVISGPSHAEEVARRVPSSVVAAGTSRDFTRRLQKAFGTPHFRVYSNPDPIGVELGGALKNVIAIAAGLVDGLGYGDNTKAALVTRGIVEMRRLAMRMGAKGSTFFGLAGIGDLITTSFSEHGRNRAVGIGLASGKSLQEVLASFAGVSEGVNTARSVVTLARRHNVEMPICTEVHAILFEGKKPEDALRTLMMRTSKSEDL